MAQQIFIVTIQRTPKCKPYGQKFSRGSMDCIMVIQFLDHGHGGKHTSSGFCFHMMKKLVAESIGTFALVFAGTGAIVINDISRGTITHPGIALTFGLVVLAMIYTLGDISGAHLNPAVTLGFWAARRLSGRDVAPYVFSQIIGAIAASAALRILFPQNRTLGATLPAGSELQSFVLEMILTFLLMLTILNVSTGAKEKGITAGIAVGSVIGLEAMFAGPVCGASMNPARSLAPALVAGHFEHLWIYLLAPPLGACAAMFACRCVREEGCCATVKTEPAL
jgi:aquaporin Z